MLSLPRGALGVWPVNRFALSHCGDWLFLIAVIYLNGGDKSPTQTFSFSVRIRREPADRANDQGMHA
ncbi:hypothetical protein Sant_1321 [Sodalis praecaptivus]|uniref:Uncharacterized protein n=1 Tax=Sodalis praecaptivus TaxID=1239307 RepID=W0HVZ3_9GAMM|nr:hypothetical protein Sant_1321 [Sodalis praecaptivus]